VTGILLKVIVIKPNFNLAYNLSAYAVASSNQHEWHFYDNLFISSGQSSCLNCTKSANILP